MSISYFYSLKTASSNDFKAPVKIRAGVFYGAEGEIFKSDKTHKVKQASILTGLKSSSSSELIDKVIFKMNLV